MTIRCIYTQEPSFPPTDQDPQARRVQIGSVWVDYVGATPVQADVDAILSPPLTAEQLRMQTYRVDPSRQSLVALIQSSTPAQINTWLTNNVTNLAQARGVLAQLILLIGGNALN